MSSINPNPGGGSSVDPQYILTGQDSGTLTLPADGSKILPSQPAFGVVGSLITGSLSSVVVDSSGAVGGSTGILDDSGSYHASGMLSLAAGYQAAVPIALGAGGGDITVQLSFPITVDASLVSLAPVSVSTGGSSIIGTNFAGASSISFSGEYLQTCPPVDSLAGFHNGGGALVVSGQLSGDSVGAWLMFIWAQTPFWQAANSLDLHRAGAVPTPALASAAISVTAAAPPGGPADRGDPWDPSDSSVNWQLDVGNPLNGTAVYYGITGGVPTYVCYWSLADGQWLITLWSQLGVTEGSVVGGYYAGDPSVLPAGFTNIMFAGDGRVCNGNLYVSLDGPGTNAGIALDVLTNDATSALTSIEVDT